MKVFVFGIRGFPAVGGGAEKHSEELYPRLVKLGCDITVLTRRPHLSLYKGVKFIPIPYINSPSLETMSHSILCSLYCLWKRPDVIHIHNIGACLLIPFLSLTGTKVVVTIHSLNYQHKKWGHFARFILNLCEDLAINFTHRKIVVSMEFIEFLQTKFHRKVSLNFIPNGIKKAQYIKAGLTLKTYKLKQRKYILAVGRLVPEKGFDKLIKAYKKIPNPDYKLVIVGNNEHSTVYKHSLFNEKNDNIILTGALYDEKLAELYSNAGLFVSTSTHEGFPLVVYEALSYNLPILLSKILAHHIGLSSHNYFDNEEELIEKIKNLMKTGLIVKEVYEKILKKNYSWDNIAQQTQEFYK